MRWGLVVFAIGCGHHPDGNQPPVPDAAATMPDGAVSAHACVPRTTGYVTDRDVHAEPTLPSLPAAGGTFVDPTFGTTIVRATDEHDCASCTTAYSYWPTF